MLPKISVVVPAYNVAPWIGKTVDSILSQCYTNLEVIAVDDGSADETGEILDGFAARDPRVVVIHQPNGGLVRARETGIAHASGDYVTFVDGDDTIEPDMYERLMDNALKYDAEISHCGMSFDFPDGRVELHYGTGQVLVQDGLEGLRELLNGQRVEPSLCTKLFARHLLADSCPDPTVLNNEDLLRNFVLFSRAKRSVFEDFCGYHYYQRPGSMSRDPGKVVQSMQHIMKARKLILDNSPEQLRPDAMRLWLSTYVNFLNQYDRSEEPQIRSFCSRCRDVLKKERRNIRCLVKSQQIAACLLLYAPWAHRIVYHVYESWRDAK
ncbi:MAG: glycosyltransferase [Oscillospiraceae bacterium]|nr:glycosyltransferase [Oscillospiraceae bacterium]